MNTIKFKFYNVNLNLLYDESHLSTVKWLSDDFSYFLSSGFDNAEENIRIELYSTNESSSRNEILVQVFKTKMTKVYWSLKGSAFYRFKNNSMMQVFESANLRKAMFFGPSDDISYEALYTFILSAVGELLDIKHLHRIHALAFSNDKKSAYLFVMPSGTGKSTLSYSLRDKFALLSDEMPLVSADKVFCFPTRVALSSQMMNYFNLDTSKYRKIKRTGFDTKWIVDQKSKIDGEPRAIKKIFFVTDKADCTHFTKVSKLKALYYMFIYLVVGWQLTQMTEFMIRPKSFIRIGYIFFLRLAQTFRLLKNTHFFSMQISKQVNETVLFFEKNFK